MAQTYPSRVIRIIVPYPPGGGADITARPIAQMLSERWGQPVIIENHGGASGMIGADIVAKAPPDGYTLLVSASAEVALNVALFPKMPYDPVRDFAPITLATVTPMALVVHSSVPVTSLKEYIAIARAKPGSMTFGSVGNGTPHHFAGEWLKMLTKVDIVHVPYKGSGPLIIDLLGGHSPSGFATLLPAMQHMKSGKLRALAVTTQKRVPLLPDVPALAETLPGFDISQWNAVWAPAATPKDVLDKLSAEITRIVQSPDYKARMSEQGSEAIGNSPSELAAFQKAEIDKYRKIAQEANIKVDQ
ncbi:Bug family tripartite tricarboxylate transporter substrate binding protein [Variovorax sp. LjRoot178]|uniref:Bug family tripartite tricarboxylate transporter substrate binding protein n=1 Tax=Variovorax sp. LjRoot178 TaxID=3342277 RepID=UPI003F50D7AB